MLPGKPSSPGRPGCPGNPDSPFIPGNPCTPLSPGIPGKPLGPKIHWMFLKLWKATVIYTLILFFSQNTSTKVIQLTINIFNVNFTLFSLLNCWINPSQQSDLLTTIGLILTVCFNFIGYASHVIFCHIVLTVHIKNIFNIKATSCLQLALGNRFILLSIKTSGCPLT